MIEANWKLEPLTIDDLKIMEPSTIFKTGYAMIKHPWYEPIVPEYKWKSVDENGLCRVKYVAVRGTIHDWAIYHSLDANLEPDQYLDGITHLKANIQRIYKAGAKLHDPKKIRELVPCTDEAFKMYRH